jgi:murein DD-endopeptidase MepM/ murein hydrolase activator NlpD
VRRRGDFYMEAGASRLSFREPRRRRRWPLLLSVLVLAALGLGFATYLEPPQNSPAAASLLPADDTALAATGVTRVEIVSVSVPTPLPVDAPMPEPVTVSTRAAPEPPAAAPFPLAMAAPIPEDAGRAPDENAAHPAKALLEAARETDALPDADDADTIVWQEHVVASGDTLSSIFSQLGIHSQLHPVLAVGGSEAVELQRLYPGERLRAGTREGNLETLIYEPRKDHYIEITRASTDGEFVAHRQEHDLTVERRTIFAEIQQSLFLDGSRAGLSNGTLMQIAEIFGWDIDFAWDIRQGDRVIVVYERVYRDGEYLRDGPVLAAEFQNQGRTLRALRFAPQGGDPDYYTPEGGSLRQAFIRTPVDVGRISSHFGPRKHPVLGYNRQHQGVDYAAPTGTPIRAAGNGRIVHRGNRGGYGKTIIVDHGNNRQTLYAHMNAFRNGQSVGSRVRQGEVIGYVGMTGLATGPHLHYEFHMQGKPVNPVTVELPRSEPLPKKHMAAFLEATEPLLAAIDTLRETQVAEGPLGAGSH